MLRIRRLLLCCAAAVVAGAAPASAQVSEPALFSTYEAELWMVGVHEKFDRYEHGGDGYEDRESAAWTIRARIPDVAFMGYQPAGGAVAEILEVGANGTVTYRDWNSQGGQSSYRCEGDALDPVNVSGARHGPKATTAGVPVEWITVDNLTLRFPCTGDRTEPSGLELSYGDLLNAHYLVPLEVIHTPEFKIPIKSKPDQCARRNIDTQSCRHSWSGTVTYKRTSIERLDGDDPGTGSGGTGTAPPPPPAPAPEAPPCRPRAGKACIAGGETVVIVGCAKACRGTVAVYPGNRRRAAATAPFELSTRGTKLVRIRLRPAARRAIARAGRARVVARTRSGRKLLEVRVSGR